MKTRFSTCVNNLKIILWQKVSPNIHGNQTNSDITDQCKLSNTPNKCPSIKCVHCTGKSCSYN